MAKKRTSKPATKPVAPPAAQAPAPKGKEMATTPVTTVLDGSSVVMKPEPEGFLPLPPTQAPLSADQSDPTDQPDLSDPTLNQSGHTSPLEDGQGLIQAPPLEETPPVAVVTLPAAYSTHAGAPKKQAGTYYTPQPPRLR